MPKLSPTLKPFFAKMAQDLEALGEPKVATNRAEAQLEEDQRSQVTIRGFTFIQDEPESVLGTGKGPTPTDFFMASVALCENVIFARSAALNDVSIESLETVATGTWDMRGLFEAGGAEPSFASVIVETRVKSDSPLTEVVNVARMTHRRCPVHATLRRATALTFRLVVNGVEAPL